VATLYTVDASVFLNAFNPYEPGHAESRQLLAHLQAQGTPIAVPTLLLPEVAAAIGRGRQDETLARSFAGALARLPHLVWVPLDRTLAEQAVDVVAQYHLPGSDAVYAAVALRFGSTLVTLDGEQRERVKAVLAALSPTEALGQETLENKGSIQLDLSTRG
jgi:predicted nucleic acid-binding protein